MSKLSHQQQRRIHNHRQNKLAAGDRADAALVVAHLGYQLIVDDHGEILAADWRQKLGAIAVNDRVLITRDQPQHAIVEGIYPREKTLYKQHAGKLKPVASNIDQLLITFAPVPDWQNALLDRFLVAAHQAHIEPAFFCNKSDLFDAQTFAAAENRLAIYHQLGYRVFYGSIYQKTGLEELTHWLSGRQTVICGQSGVGKSSFIHYLMPDIDVWTQAVSAASGFGQHTTRNARRYPLDAHTAIIDTPGVRGFSLTHLQHSEIVSGFPEIHQYTHECRFNDCSHQHEPDCGVQRALERGDISLERFNSMMQICAEREV